MTRRSDRNLVLALLVVGAAAAVAATAYWLRPSTPGASASALAPADVAVDPAARVERTVALERPAERSVVTPAPVAPAAPAPSPFEAKYAGAGPGALADAHADVAERLRTTCAEVLAERFRRGEFETHVVAAGREHEAGPRPNSWSESVRRTPRDDGAVEVQVAGFAQDVEPRTRDLYAELAWLGAHRVESAR